MTEEQLAKASVSSLLSWLGQVTPRAYVRWLRETQPELFGRWPEEDAVAKLERVMGDAHSCLADPEYRAQRFPEPRRSTGH